MRVMSFNARTSSLPSKAHGWPDRRELVIQIVHKYRPDVVGFQEVQRDQLEDLVPGLHGYGCHHQGWQAVECKQELLPVFYLKERISVVASGSFWLNSTPDVPRIDDGGGEVLRACTWMHVSCPAVPTGTGAPENTRAYALYHTHFDHQAEWRREASARLVLERMSAQSAGIPVILFGDLNTRPGSTTYRLLRGQLRDAFLESPTPRGEDEITCHGFTGATRRAWYRTSFQWIDHVLIDGAIQCVGTQRVVDATGGARRSFPSDHYPVIADLA